MTMAEAEKIYDDEVKKCEEEHIEDKEKKKEKIENQEAIRIIISIIIMIVGVILLLIGVTAPPEVSSITGNESTPFYAIMLIIYGIILGIIGVSVLLYTFITTPKKLEKVENEKVSYYLPNKHLYMNYLICTDMNDSYKEYYKQKLADMKYSELALSVDNATSAAAAAADAANDAADMAAISALYNTIKK